MARTREEINLARREARAEINRKEAEHYRWLSNRPSGSLPVGACIPSPFRRGLVKNVALDDPATQDLLSKKGPHDAPS